MLTEDIQGLHAVSYKASWKEIKDSQLHRKVAHAYRVCARALLEWQHSSSWSMCQFNTTFIKIPIILLAGRNLQVDSRIHMEIQRTQKRESNFAKQMQLKSMLRLHFAHSEVLGIEDR